MPRQRLEPEARRALILDAAAAVFADHGPGVSTRAIARAAGVSEALLFHYFPDKDALWVAVASRAGTFAGRLHGVLDDGAPLAQVVAQVVAAYAEVQPDERRLVAILLGAALRDEPLGAAVRAAHTQMVVELGAALARQGYARPGPEAEAAATAFIGAFVLDFLTHHREDAARWPDRARAFARALTAPLHPPEAPDVQQRSDDP